MEEEEKKKEKTRCRMVPDGSDNHQGQDDHHG